MSSILLAINLAAIINGLMVGGVLLLQERFGPARTRLTLAGFLILIALLLALFVALDGGGLNYSPAIGLAMDLGALLAAGFLLDYVANAMGPKGVGLWPYAPTSVYLIATALNGGRFGAPTDMTPVIVTQISMSLVAGAVWFRGRKNLPANWARRAENRRLPILLGGMALLHAAQLLRLAAPESSLLFNLVPLIGASGLLAFAAYAIVGSQTLTGLVRAREPQGGGLPAEALKDALRRSGHFLDPDLSLSKAAALLDLAPHKLSRNLNAHGGAPFRQTVNALRIEQACRMLRDPAEARTSIEAISELCGFRSRSRFYVAFQNEVGMSPAAYREASDPPIF